MKRIAKKNATDADGSLLSSLVPSKCKPSASVKSKLKSTASKIHKQFGPVPHSSQDSSEKKCHSFGSNDVKSAKQSSKNKKEQKLKVTNGRTTKLPVKSTELKSDDVDFGSNDVKSAKQSSKNKKKQKLKVTNDRTTKLPVKSTELKSDDVDLSFAEIEKKIFEGLQTQPKVHNSRKKKISENLSPSNCKNISKSNDSSITPSKNTPTISVDTVNKLNKSHHHSHKKVNGKKEKLNEKKINLSKPKKPKTKKNIADQVKTESNSDISDWEEVDELSEILQTNENSNDTGKNIEIELEANNVLWGIKKRKRRTEQELIEDYLRKQVNRSIKEIRVNMHKAHLLCLLAHGMYINSCMAVDTLLSSALSIIPKNYFTPKRLDVSHLEKILTWFCNCITIQNNDKSDVSQMNFSGEILQKRFAEKYASNTKELVLMFVTTSRAVGMAARLVQSLSPLSWKPPTDSLIKPTQNDSNNSETKTSVLSESPISTHASDKKKLKKKSRKMLSTDSEHEHHLNPKLKSKKLKSKVAFDDDDFEDTSINFQKPSSSKIKYKDKVRSNKRQSSETVNKEKKKQKVSLGEWAEVYVEEEEKWISVDVTRCKIHCASEIEARIPSLSSYIVAFNPDQTVKDVTRRYVSNWLSCKDKIQYDGKWWAQSLKPFLGKRDRKDKDEDEDLDGNLRMQPLPKTLTNYKNHALYALQRHLLKFEAIYPPDETPVGYFRGEPVFPRSSVKTLAGRDYWIKEAKTVKVDEEPYKVVKARPKWDKSTYQVIKDRPLELFGEWQIEDYEPPIAKNGKVPRNEYGNVELFKPSMLPKGCVHLRVNGLTRIARKLNIDCASAMVGFEFQRGGSYPLYDGFVVCEEFKDIMMDAWNQEQFEQAKREVEKRLKRIYDNWKRLITGISLKVRLKERYGVSAGAATGNGEDVRDEKTERAKQKKGRIKQEDLDSLSSAVITHSIPNLKIDFSGVIAAETSGPTRSRKVRKGSSKPRRNEPRSADDGATSTTVQTFSSESEAEANLEEKREKIRTILQWNPETIDSQRFGSTLSDESDSEAATDGTADSTMRLSSLLSAPSSFPQGSRDRKTRSTGVKQSKGISRKVASSNKKRIAKDDSLSLSSDSEIEHQSIPASSLGSQRRRSRRNQGTKTHIKYTESDRSDPDISVDESDTGDKAYNPLVESAHRRVNLSSESE